MGNIFSRKDSKEDPNKYLNYLVLKNKEVWEKETKNKTKNTEIIHEKSLSNTKKSSYLCCFKFEEASETYADMKWYNHLKFQCQNLKKKYSFASIILKFVHEFSQKNDCLQSYLSDIQWFDYQQGIYDIDNKKEIKNSESSFSKSSDEGLQSMVSNEENKNEIEKMLENAQIINEEFYKVTENQEIIVKNDIKKLKSKKNIRHYSSFNSSYQNNTFIQNMNIEEEFMNNSDNYHNNEEQIDVNLIHMKKCLFHYKGITEKIEIHLKDKKNLFGYILCEFNKFYIHKYQKILHTNNNQIENNSEFKEKILHCFSELKEFIKLFEEIISIFYKLSDYKNVLKYFLFTKENFHNFITSIVFHEKLYSLVFEAQRKLDWKLEQNLLEKFKIMNKFNPEDLDISHKYCLNKISENFLLEKKKKNESETNHISKITIDSEIESNTKKNSINLKTSYFELNKKNYNEEEITCKLINNCENYYPYIKSIRNFRKIEKMKSPLHKLKNIAITGKLIEKEIKEFYRNRKINFTEQIGGDDLLPIHIYIIIKSEIPSLYSHCALIDRFLSSTLTNSIAGYYLVTIQVGLKYISSYELSS